MCRYCERVESAVAVGESQTLTHFVHQVAGARSGSRLVYVETVIECGISEIADCVDGNHYGSAEQAYECAPDRWPQCRCCCVGLVESSVCFHQLAAWNQPG